MMSMVSLTVAGESECVVMKSLGEVPKQGYIEIEFLELLDRSKEFDGRKVKVTGLLTVPPRGIGGIDMLVSFSSVGWRDHAMRIHLGFPDPDGWRETLVDTLEDFVYLPVSRVIGRFYVNTAFDGEVVGRSIVVEYLEICEESWNER
jgi:hypothetical protein